MSANFRWHSGGAAAAALSGAPAWASLAAGPTAACGLAAAPRSQPALATSICSICSTRCSSARLNSPAAPSSLCRATPAGSRSPCWAIVSRSASSAAVRGRLEDVGGRDRHRARGLGDGGIALEGDHFAAKLGRRALRQIGGAGEIVRALSRAPPAPAAASASTTRPRLAGIDGGENAVFARHIDKCHDFAVRARCSVLDAYDL